MGQLEDAFRDAAGEVAQIKAQPSNRYWWLYGTIRKKNGNGTLDVEIDGVTIQQVRATVSCMMANVGDRVVVLKAGPIMTCIDSIAVSGTHEIPSAMLPKATPKTLGGVTVGDGLSVTDEGELSFNGGFYAKELGIWKVLQIGRFCICSCVWTASFSVASWNAWGVLYDSNVEFVFPDYPVAFRDMPASFVDYVAAGSNSATGFVERGHNATKTSAGSAWLARPNNINHIYTPSFAIVACGWV